MSNTASSVAATIVHQLGNSALSMLGAKDLLATETGLQFKIRGAMKVNVIQIDLADDDTYTVRFRKFVAPRFSSKTLEMSEGTNRLLGEFAGVYVDGLKSLIESSTGLLVSIGGRG